jgi:signal transduction histidine kinase
VTRSGRGPSSGAAPEQRAERLRSLNAVSRLVSSSLRAGEVLDEVARAAQELLRVELVRVWILDPAGLEVELATSAGEQFPDRGQFRRLPVDGTIIGKVLQSSGAYQIEDAQKDPNWRNTGFIRSAGLHGYLGVPLMAQGRPLGILSILSRERRRFSEDDVEVMRSFAAQAATAIANAHLYRQAERRARRLAAWSAASRLVTSSLEIQGVVDAVVRSAREVLEVDQVRLWTLDEASGDLLLNASSDAWPAERGWITRMPVEGSLLGTVLTSGRVYQTTDVVHHPQLRNRRYVEAEGLHGYIAVPLMLRERPFGVLALFTRERRAFDPDEVSVLEALGLQAAIALENARLFEVVGQVAALRELDRLKSEFLSTVSHELRTPLSYIHGYAELLAMRDFEPSMVREMARDVHRGSSAMIRLVEQLLDVARIESGQFALHPVPTDLSELLRSVAARFQAQSSAHRIVLDLPPDQLPLVAVDPDRLGEVISHLVTNAIQYSPDGGPVLIGARRRDRVIRVEVNDQGIGIPHDQQPRVFERFYRGADAASSPRRGSGLGLAIVKLLVEAHDGEVGVASVAGGGSTFWFTLPIRPADGASARLPAGSAPALGVG